MIAAKLGDVASRPYPCRPSTRHRRRCKRASPCWRRVSDFLAVSYRGVDSAISNVFMNALDRDVLPPTA